MILQLIPAISSLTPITTAVPLAFVLCVTLVKDGVDDYKRHQSDALVNSRTCKVLRAGTWQVVEWMNVVVGDILRLENNQFVPVRGCAWWAGKALAWVVFT